MKIYVLFYNLGEKIATFFVKTCIMNFLSVNIKFREIFWKNSYLKKLFFVN